MGIEFLLIGMQTDAEFIYYALILIYAEEVKTAINLISDKAESMKKYM